MDPDTGRILIQGECYPENAFRFFMPLFDWVREYTSGRGGVLDARFRLDYFNSSTSKCLLDFFELLEEHQKKHGSVTVTWYYEADDEDIKESGEDFSEDMSFPFHIQAADAE
jgi:hypothetical protein